jgi:hypothetical protein
MVWLAWPGKGQGLLLGSGLSLVECDPSELERVLFRIVGVLGGVLIIMSLHVIEELNQSRVLGSFRSIRKFALPCKRHSVDKNATQFRRRELGFSVH